MKLPKEVLNFAKKFHENKFQIYLVGGAVRDYLIKGNIIDYDFTTDATPEEVMKIFKSVVPVGINHGTVMVLFEKFSFEVTTFRSDGKYSDNRHPDSITFIKSLDEDLKRRDFTINALAYDIINNKIIDMFNGKDDIKNKIIKAIGEPADRFNEDSLRMLRACRFSSQLNFKIEDNTLDAIRKMSKKINNISTERTRDEIIKLMQTDMPSVGLEYMRITGLMDEILPELSSCYGIYQNRFHKYDVYYHNLYTCDASDKNNYLLRLASLFHDIAKPQTRRGKDDSVDENSFYNHEVIGAKIARRILKRLKFKNSDVISITHLIKHHMFYYTSEWTDGAVRRFIRNVGLENIDELFKLREADRIGNGMKYGIPEAFINFQNRIKKILELDNAFKITDLNIDGNVIMKVLKLTPGPIIGEILNYLLEIVLDNPELNKKKLLIEHAVEYYKKKKEYALKNFGKSPENLGKF